MAKLLGYQYSIVYKPRKENRVADALSWQPDELIAKFLAISQRFTFLDSLRHKNATSAFFLAKYRDLKEGLIGFDEYEVRYGLLLHKGRLFLDPNS